MDPKNYVGTELVKESDRCVALGDEGPEVEVAEVEQPPANDHERMNVLEQRINQLALAIDSIHSILKKMRDRVEGKKNFAINQKIEKVKSENKIPEGTVLTGVTKGVPYYLEVKNGGFYVGVCKFDTLSAAAEEVSGTRRSGWTFWKLPDGRTVKEVFKG